MPRPGTPEPHACHTHSYINNVPRDLACLAYWCRGTESAKRGLIYLIIWPQSNLVLFQTMILVHCTDKLILKSFRFGSFLLESGQIFADCGTPVLVYYWWDLSHVQTGPICGEIIWEPDWCYSRDNRPDLFDVCGDVWWTLFDDRNNWREISLFICTGTLGLGCYNCNLTDTSKDGRE